MKNKDLIRILKQLDSEKEISIQISECNSERILGTSYAVASEINEFNELVLKVNLDL